LQQERLQSTIFKSILYNDELEVLFKNIEKEVASQ